MQKIFDFFGRHGGLTENHALAAGSPAIDSGNPAAPGSSVAACELLDQRRFRRDADDVAPYDIGAFEFNAAPEMIMPGPRTIVQNTTLDQNQTGGIIIGRDDIVLDCAFHTIEGPDDGTGTGIELKLRKGVTVRNCTVTKFRNGFNIEDSTLNVIAHNIATNNRNDGFHILRSEGNIFDDNTAEKNDDDGFDIDGGKANFFRSNVVHENKNKGFNIDSSLANFFIDNTSDENTDRGFRVSHVSRYNPFAGNKACNNKGRFDFEENSHPNFFRGNVFCKEPKEPSPGRIRNSERF